VHAVQLVLAQLRHVEMQQPFPEAQFLHRSQKSAQGDKEQILPLSGIFERIDHAEKKRKDRKQHRQVLYQAVFLQKIDLRMRNEEKAACRDGHAD